MVGLSHGRTATHIDHGDSSTNVQSRVEPSRAMAVNIFTLREQNCPKPAVLVGRHEPVDMVSINLLPAETQATFWKTVKQHHPELYQMALDMTGVVKAFDCQFKIPLSRYQEIMEPTDVN